MKMDNPGEVRADEQLDEAALAAWLQSTVPGLTGPMSVTQFHGGHANLTYMVSFGDQELVVRRPPLGPVAPKSHDMGREFRALAGLTPQFPHSPRPLGFCEDESVLGAPFLVMERRQGYVIRSEWPAFLPDDPALRRRISEDLVDALADLHMVDTSTPELSTLGRPEGFVERQVRGWLGRWEAAKTREIPDMDRAAAWCLEHIPVPQSVSVLHNDYKLDNCMYGADDPGRLVAIFDWDMASLGDPLVDLGTLLGYWSEATDDMGRGTVGGVSTLDGFLKRDELAERYAARTGLDLSEIGFYETFALFKTAVVLEQIYVRWVRGQTKDARFEGLGSIVPQLAAGAVRGCV